MAREQLGRGLCARSSGSKGFLRATTRSLSVRSRACALSYEFRLTRGAENSAASRSRAKSARFGSRLRPPLLPDWEMLARRRNRLPHLGSGSTCHLRALASSRNTRPREPQSPPSLFSRDAPLSHLFPLQQHTQQLPAPRPHAVSPRHGRVDAHQLVPRRQDVPGPGPPAQAPRSAARRHARTVPQGSRSASGALPFPSGAVRREAGGGEEVRTMSASRWARRREGARRARERALATREAAHGSATLSACSPSTRTLLLLAPTLTPTSPSSRPSRSRPQSTSAPRRRLRTSRSTRAPSCITASRSMRRGGRATSKSGGCVASLPLSRPLFFTSEVAADGGCP